MSFILNWFFGSNKNNEKINEIEKNSKKRNRSNESNDNYLYIF